MLQFIIHSFINKPMICLNKMSRKSTRNQWYEQELVIKTKHSNVPVWCFLWLWSRVTYWMWISNCRYSDSAGYLFKVIECVELLLDCRKGQERNRMTCHILDWKSNCQIVCVTDVQATWSQIRYRVLTKTGKDKNKAGCRTWFLHFSMLELQLSRGRQK